MCRSPDPLIAAFQDRMAADGQPAAAIRAFSGYLDAMFAGKTGLIPEVTITPVASLPTLDSLEDSQTVGRAALSQTVVLKLNGGLGTSMGMRRAKSLLPVKAGLSFLDITARQLLWLRKRHGVALPLLLMNSFRTHADSLAALAAYPNLQRPELPLGFCQHRVPKIDVQTRRPAEHPAAPELTWCPPGHGDLYVALGTSGLLDRLLSQGMRYLFVSNVDNLGATLNLALLGHMARHRLPFVMEVCQRTATDRKGGHLAQTADGRLLLRETAQCPAADRTHFQDITRHRFFNTNNLWVDLQALADRLAAQDGVLRLPIICNRKPLDPADPTSPPVIQLETAMGAAIAVFDSAQAVWVPRSRFSPVKTTSDWLRIASDSFVLGPDWRVSANPQRTLGPLQIDLDPRYYKTASALQSRMPDGPPSLVRCRSLTVRGDHLLPADAVWEGDVVLDTASTTTP